MNIIRYIIICVFFSLLSIHTSLGQTVWKKYRSSVKIGIGYFPLIGLDNNIFYTLSPEFISIYEDKKCHYPAINFKYSYSLFKRLDLEMTLGYTSIVTTFRNTFTDNKEGKIYRDIFFASPEAVFYWNRRNSFSLYSSLGVSFVETHLKDKGNTYSLENDDPQILLNATILGITFGKKIYGFVELGANVSGCIQSGIGYRF